MIVAMDGPAGSGKSTIARKLSDILGFEYLRTGLMYRAVALAGLRANADWSQPHRLAEIARAARITFGGPSVFLNGENVTREAETQEVTAITKYAADNAQVRRFLIELQREYVVGKDCIAEGRDLGTLVFPNAECKFYLDATPEERARRRCAQKRKLGEPADYEAILRGIRTRDYEDEHRAFGPLKKADDAFVLMTDPYSIEQVVEILQSKVLEIQKRKA